MLCECKRESELIRAKKKKNTVAVTVTRALSRLQTGTERLTAIHRSQCHTILCTSIGMHFFRLHQSYIHRSIFTKVATLIFYGSSSNGCKNVVKQ